MAEWQNGSSAGCAVVYHVPEMHLTALTTYSRGSRVEGQRPIIILETVLPHLPSHIQKMKPDSALCLIQEVNEAINQGSGHGFLPQNRHHLTYQVDYLTPHTVLRIQ